MTNPKDAIGLTKPALRLVPPALSLHVAQAMSDGAKKYGPYNWREQPVRLTVYIEAALRHLYSLLDGEDCARDSGHEHAAHVAACMAIILDSKGQGTLIDDRATPGPAADIIEELTEKNAPPAATVSKKSSGAFDVKLPAGIESLFRDCLISFGEKRPEPQAPWFPTDLTDLTDEEIESLRGLGFDPAVPERPTLELVEEPDPFPEEPPTFTATTYPAREATPAELDNLPCPRPAWREDPE